ncbi:protein mothers against dpp-like [Macrobrachium rosenbergii]|uniref:protein mothers against dpp-like n=1 Tax=Macrobrachium rosenbergii TaxID=79674 RepID=UPI0034D439EB
MSRFQASLSSCFSSVKRELLTYTQDEVSESWATYGIKSLVKTKATAEALLRLVRTNNLNAKLQSNCIVTPQRHSGCVRILGQGWPLHVVSCKIFRWPYLSDPKQLQPLEECTPAEGEVCINPYHYRLTVPEILMFEEEGISVDESPDDSFSLRPECEVD